MGLGNWIKNEISIAWRSQLRSLKHGGTAEAVMAERAKIKAEDRVRWVEQQKQMRHYPPPSRKDGYFSTSEEGKVGVFIAPNGDITSERPHVHIVHSEFENRIIITPTMSDGRHLASEYLPLDASENEVNAVVNRLRGKLR